MPKESAYQLIMKRSAYYQAFPRLPRQVTEHILSWLNSKNVATARGVNPDMFLCTQNLPSTRKAIIAQLKEIIRLSSPNNIDEKQLDTEISWPKIKTAIPDSPMLDPQIITSLLDNIKLWVEPGINIIFERENSLLLAPLQTLPHEDIAKYLLTHYPMLFIKHPLPHMMESDFFLRRAIRIGNIPWVTYHKQNTKFTVDTDMLLSAISSGIPEIVDLIWDSSIQLPTRAFTIATSINNFAIFKKVHDVNTHGAEQSLKLSIAKFGNKPILREFLHQNPDEKIDLSTWETAIRELNTQALTAMAELAPDFLLQNSQDISSLIDQIAIPEIKDNIRSSISTVTAPAASAILRSGSDSLINNLLFNRGDMQPTAEKSEEESDQESSFNPNHDT